MLDHITVHVPEKTLDGDKIARFMSLIGFREIRPDDLYEHGYKVRWFTAIFVGESSPNIHFVETEDGEQDMPALGHFCIKASKQKIRDLASGRFCVRDSGSGRIWLQMANIRVEVRP